MRPTCVRAAETAADQPLSFSCLVSELCNLKDPPETCHITLPSDSTVREELRQLLSHVLDFPALTPYRLEYLPSSGTGSYTASNLYQCLIERLSHKVQGLVQHDYTSRSTPYNTVEYRICSFRLPRGLSAVSVLTVFGKGHLPTLFLWRSPHH